MNPPTPLPASWVDRLFAKLAVTYGRDFLSRWEGVDLALVKADWAHELAGLSGESIAYALSVLPADKPPTVRGFRDLALRAPAPKLPALDAPPSDPAVVEAALRSIRPLQGGDARSWALELKRREEAGDPLSLFQRHCWREALGAHQQPEAA